MERHGRRTDHAIPAVTEMSVNMRPIAYIYTPYPEKFGIPRQSGLIDEVESRIVFEQSYRVPEALRGLEGFSHIWLIWEFSEAHRTGWSPTVKPPRLGGNRRVGVFATRSPFRPNSIGLSCVRLIGIEMHTPQGPVLHVSGADLMDRTPIYDIKPYLPYADCHPEATDGFAGEVDFPPLKVDIEEDLYMRLPVSIRAAALSVIEQDPRPAYRRGDETRTWGVSFAGWNLRFTVSNGIARVTEVTPLTPDDACG